MRKLFVVAAVFCALLADVAAADETTGEVTEINPDEQTFSLDNGMTFSVSDDIKIDGLSPGDTVKVTYEKQDSENIATEVERPEN